MTPRPRKKGSKDLPQNLYSKKIKGVVYYQYKNPETKKFFSFGKDKKKAIDAANQLNQMLVSETNLVQVVTKTDNLMRDLLDNFRDKILPEKRINGFPLSAKTLQRYNQYIQNISSELGHIDISDLTQRRIAEFLNDQSSAEVFNKYRSFMIMFYKQAVSDGLVSENLPEKILKKDKEQVKRQRLTLDEYKAIYAEATRATEKTMELDIVEDMRGFEIDHEPEGWPAVKMRQISALCDEVERLRADSARLDWLADPANKVGNVQLPTHIVTANLHSMRDAIDAAMQEQEPNAMLRGGQTSALSLKLTTKPDGV